MRFADELRESAVIKLVTKIEDEHFERLVGGVISLSYRVPDGLLQPPVLCDIVLIRVFGAMKGELLSLAVFVVQLHHVFVCRVAVSKDEVPLIAGIDERVEGKDKLSGHSLVHWIEKVIAAVIKEKLVHHIEPLSQRDFIVPNAVKELWQFEQSALFALIVLNRRIIDLGQQRNFRRLQRIILAELDDKAVLAVDIGSALRTDKQSRPLVDVWIVHALHHDILVVDGFVVVQLKHHEFFHDARLCRVLLGRLGNHFEFLPHFRQFLGVGATLIVLVRNQLLRVPSPQLRGSPSM
mmetsp:Transcript_61070/g.97140  ORF Transcript_61070/g.97140 Transcript_61070/m.97140 type:complete len:294 (-) Transcript_61070:261-1142(-)